MAGSAETSMIQRPAMHAETATEILSTTHNNIQEGFILSTAGTGTAYATLLIGYLYTLISSPQLTLVNFIVFNGLQISYTALLWWTFRREKENATGWLNIVIMALLLIITEATSLLPFLHLQWDWLLFLVTVALFFNTLQLRIAVGATIILFIIAIIDLGWINNWNWQSTYPSALTLLPAFGFVSIFSLIVQVLHKQKERAEWLLNQLEASKTDLEQAHKQLQLYADEVEELTIVRERTRMAREIHDTLGHYLSILAIQLETMAKLQERDPARLPDEIAEARRVATQSMQEVRNAVAALRPTSIATQNLDHALEQLGSEFTRSTPNTALTLDLETELPALSADISVALYRTAQEALTNIRKHARASKALIRLRYEDNTMELLIQDNGTGTTEDASSFSTGFGLIGLCERVELLGGAIWHGKADQGGYRVITHIPVSTTPTITINNASSTII